MRDEKRSLYGRNNVRSNGVEVLIEAHLDTLGNVSSESCCRLSDMEDF